jgi:hypothetical protein
MLARGSKTFIVFLSAGFRKKSSILNLVLNLVPVQEAPLDRNDDSLESDTTVALINSASRNMFLKIFENFKGLF